LLGLRSLQVADALAPEHADASAADVLATLRFHHIVEKPHALLLTHLPLIAHLPLVAPAATTHALLLTHLPNYNLLKYHTKLLRA
jgi:hypothetical protein